MKARPDQSSELQRRIVRSVASSTAIETGKSVKSLEALLRKKGGKFEKVKLAD